VIKPSLYCPGQQNRVYKVSGKSVEMEEEGVWMKRLPAGQVVRRQEEDDTLFDFTPAATE
jgi:hypothetical protein